MSIFPEFQPIIFEPYLPNECRANLYDYQSIAEHGDDATFQVVVSPCAGSENVIRDPDFSDFEGTDWAYAGGFSVSDGDACKDDDGTTGTITQEDTFVIGTSYQFQIEVVSLIGEINIYNGATLIYTVTQVGLTTFNFTATANTLIIAIENTEHYGCIRTVSAQSFSPNMSFGIIDANGDTAAVANYNDNPEYFTFVDNTVTIKFKWSDFSLADGCYTIGFADGCTNSNGQLGIFNSSFDSCFSGWETVLGTLTAVNCEALENPETGEVENCAEFENTGIGYIYSTATSLGVGISYEVTIGGFSTDADGFIRIYCGTNYDDYTASNETHTIVCAGNEVFRIEAHLQTSTFIRLWDVTVELTSLTDTVFDYESQSFKLMDSHPCTHMINLSNNDNAFGYVFVGSNFAPCVRLESEIYNSAPESIRKSYWDNLGTKKVYYGEYRKHFFFVIDHVPAWLIDFFMLCYHADHFIIDGTEYFIEGDVPQPEYGDAITNFATLRFEISEKTQLYRNQNTGNTDIPVFANAESMSLGIPASQTQSASDIIIELPTGDSVATN